MKKGTYIRTEETRKKQSLVLKGRARGPMPDKTKQKLRKSLIGNQNGKNLIGFKRTKENIENIKKARAKQIMPSGKNHWRYTGIKAPPYPKEFNAKLKLLIRTMDKFTCCLCGRTEREELEELNRVLCVNHIDFNKNNCKETNLNTLCLRCNVKINRERDYWTNYFQS